MRNLWGILKGLNTESFRGDNKIKPQEARVDFSFKREVFFIIAGGIVGALVMAIPLTFFSSAGRSHAYDLTWIVFGHIVGIYSPVSSVIIAGMTIHIIVGISIGIVSGVFLYKTNISNISKPSNGLKYGLFVGILVYLIFSLPVQRFVLSPEFRHALGDNINNNNNNSNNVTFSNIQISSILYSVSINLLFGITLGLFSSFSSIKFGARYRCPSCDISFSRIDILQNHLLLVHRDKYDKHQITTNRKRIVILGGGFGGVTVLKKLQNHFQTDVSIDITMVSKDNYLLFTPMLHEIASGMIETRHIVTPIREFCNRSRFYCAAVKNIDLEKKRVSIRSSTSHASTFAEILGSSNNSSTITDSNLLESNTQSYMYYDYLVIALGSETKFFGMSDMQQNAFTIKTINDAINLRNHIIYLLEQSDQLLLSSVSSANVDNIHDYTDNAKTLAQLQKKLLTFVIVGGGFAGVETAGEINDFIRDSVKEHYHNINSNNIGVKLVHSSDRLLPEMSEELAEFALERLRKSGIEIILNQRVIGATPNTVSLKDGTIIPTKTIIWSGGVAPSSLLTSISCEHDNKSGRITVDKYLELTNYKGVYALGDCAYILDPNSGNPYPPTAQHAIREGAIVANNIIASIEGRLENRKIFNYKTKGMMASIGKRTGIGNLLGIEVQGLLAWLIWRSYYLVHLPTLQKKLRVLADWILDIFFKRDVTMLKTFIEEEEKARRE
jgi:NADH:quinone reductase (non-electrogenic)